MSCTSYTEIYQLILIILSTSRKYKSGRIKEMLLSVIIIIICSLICCLLKFLHGRLFYWQNRGLPCVSTSFNLHQMKYFLLRSKPQEVLAKETYDELSDHKFGGYVVMFTPYLLLRDPEIIKNVLVRDFAFFEDRFMPTQDNSDSFFDNVFAMRGEHWRLVRHKLTPLFSTNKVRLMVDQVVSCCNFALSRVEQDLQPTEVENLMASYCFSVVGSTVFGLDFDSGEGDDAKKIFLDMIDSFYKPRFLILLTYVLKMGMPRLESIMRRVLGTHIGTPETCIRILTDVIKMRENTGYRRNDFLQLMIDLKHEEEASIPLNNEGSSKITCKKPSVDNQKSLPKEIIELFYGRSEENLPEKVFTDTKIFANSFLFLSIGTNSTSCVLSFMLYEISRSTDIQDRLRKEIDSVISGAKVSYDNLKQLIYMEKVIAETMRLHLPSGTLLRYCKHDYKIPGTEKIIKKGETIVIMTSAMHNDERYFLNPDKFDPDRFSNMRDILRGVYLPFGAGPRMCFAIPFVMMQLKLTICKILITYDLRLNSKTQQPLKMSTRNLMTHSEGGIWVDFQRRN